MLGQWEVPERLRVRIRALDYDAAGAHGNKWEVPKGLHVRMRARALSGRSWCTRPTMGGAEKAACAHAGALDYDADGAHSNTWEVRKGQHVRMRARTIWTQLVHRFDNGRC